MRNYNITQEDNRLTTEEEQIKNEASCVMDYTGADKVGFLQENESNERIYTLYWNNNAPSTAYAVGHEMTERSEFSINTRHGLYYAEERNY